MVVCVRSTPEGFYPPKLRCGKESNIEGLVTNGKESRVSIPSLTGFREGAKETMQASYLPGHPRPVHGAKPIQSKERTHCNALQVHSANRSSVDSAISGVDLWGNRFRISCLGKSGHWEQIQHSVPRMRL